MDLKSLHLKQDLTLVKPEVVYLQRENIFPNYKALATLHWACLFKRILQYTFCSF